MYICLGVYTSQRADSTSGCVTWTAGGTLYAFPTGGFLAAECIYPWGFFRLSSMDDFGDSRFGWEQPRGSTVADEGGWHALEVGNSGVGSSEASVRLLDGKVQWLPVFWVGVR